MEKTRAKVSIIIPCYNAEDYFEKCLQSVAGQTLTDIEIIVVDDGSDDGSVKIMDDFAGKDERIKVIHKPNSGYGNSMNRGLAAASGEYIGIVESDDFVVPEMYESLYGLTEDGTADIVKSNFWDCYDEKNGTITKVENTERREMPDVKKAFTIHEYPQILWGHPSIWTGIYRRQFLIDNDIHFKEEKGGGWVDNPFFFDTLCCAKKVKWTKTPYYCYRKTNAASSSVGYDLKIPFERMNDNLDVIEKNSHADETTLKFLYARALMYLGGAVNERHYAWNVDYAYPYMRSMLDRMNPDVILDDFKAADQRNYFKYRSPIMHIMPAAAKILIYNWVPFDNPNRAGGGVTIYCRNLIEAFLRYRPDVQIYFLSSGWAYDVTATKCYYRGLPNIFGERVRSFEIVNSPTPAPQDMLLVNPSFAFESSELKRVFADFVEKNGPFNTIHFNNIEGLSLDVFDLKADYPDTKFIYSMHNYVPLCTTGFYYQRSKHANCSPDHTPKDCENCFDRDAKINIRTEMVSRGRVNIAQSERYMFDRWALKFGWEKLDVEKDGEVLYEYTARAKAALNKNMDLILAVSERVHELAVQNGINPELVKTSYIGTKVAAYQVGRSAAKKGQYFKLAYLGAILDYEEKGYPFLLDALSKLDKLTASKTDLILTTTTRNKDNEIKKQLKHFHSVKIIHGYTHSQLPDILKEANLGVIPVLWEDNLPQVAIEMVALGVPVLCSSAGGASELCTSERFRFEAGNTEEFLEKLKYFIENPEETDDYWNHHSGLVTMKQHFDEMAGFYELPAPKSAQIGIEDYSAMLEENAFLYRHFGEGGGYNEDELKRQLDEAHRINGLLSEELENEKMANFSGKVTFQTGYDPEDGDIEKVGANLFRLSMDRFEYNDFYLEIRFVKIMNCEKSYSDILHLSGTYINRGGEAFVEFHNFEFEKNEPEIRDYIYVYNRDNEVCFFGRWPGLHCGLSWSLITLTGRADYASAKLENINTGFVEENEIMPEEANAAR